MYGNYAGYVANGELAHPASTSYGLPSYDEEYYAPAYTPSYEAAWSSSWTSSSSSSSPSMAYQTIPFAIPQLPAVVSPISPASSISLLSPELECLSTPPVFNPFDASVEAAFLAILSGSPPSYTPPNHPPQHGPASEPVLMEPYFQVPPSTSHSTSSQSSWSSQSSDEHSSAAPSPSPREKSPVSI
ncbi:hypothetical protein BOTBODRAFT_495364 [Botryobasidium botryosum FD-172 SS1]|uniref:Uncharacterized protein n=1 Tax=Botryobasidium botryosum (strain FD-172 SS1) TaxID=930990 RepID=A0A067M3Q5_BOTB1|nr:hypothetical protein BOTBODRAFT_495364 [Botryobasidium botryosum FD-172 SS1]